MWAFALAVQVRRRSNPGASGWALQAGVWAFAAVAAGLNVVHGLQEGTDAAVVMGVASVAGVAAHQLVTTGALRSRRERKENRDTRRAARRVAAAERAAVRSAVAEIDADGRARLVVVPGRYRVSRRRLVPAVVVAGLPVEPAGPDGVGDELAAEITAWLAGQPAAPAAPGPVEPQPDPSAEPTAGGGVATLDPPRPANPRECGPLGCGRWTSSARSSGPRSPTPPRWWTRNQRSRSAPPCAAPRPGHGSSATNTPDPPPAPIDRPVTSDDRGKSRHDH
ncbi:MAG: traI [Pseudonocardia sp.]|nr:traI [Pseudonocardia sp.]